MDDNYYHTEPVYPDEAASLALQEVVKEVETGLEDTAVNDIMEDDIVEEEGVKPTKLTISEYKNMMRQFFTVRRQTVKDCGHKYNELSEPRTNCNGCWFAWLNAHGDMIKICDELFVQPGGESALVKIKGRKFVQNFKKFMSTIARWKVEETIKNALKCDPNNQCVHNPSGSVDIHCDECKKGLNVGSEEQGKPVQEPTGVGEDSKREAEDNNVASPVGG